MAVSRDINILHISVCIINNNFCFSWLYIFKYSVVVVVFTFSEHKEESTNKLIALTTFTIALDCNASLISHFLELTVQKQTAKK